MYQRHSKSSEQLLPVRQKKSAQFAPRPVTHITSHNAQRQAESVAAQSQHQALGPGFDLTQGDTITVSSRTAAPGPSLLQARQASDQPQPDGIRFAESHFGRATLIGQLLQARLKVGAAHDPYEQEADRVAAQVVNQSHSVGVGQPLIQRAEHLDTQPKFQRLPQRQPHLLQDGEAATNLETAINQAKGSGQPLDTGLQQVMGQAMGADFSPVRIHTDTKADGLNQSIQAKAFTTGQDIFFRQGEYQPKTQNGQELIAHELTHVMQQAGGTLQRSPIPLQNPPKEISSTANLGATPPIVQRRIDPSELINLGQHPEYEAVKSVWQTKVLPLAQSLLEAIQTIEKTDNQKATLLKARVQTPYQKAYNAIAKKDQYNAANAIPLLNQLIAELNTVETEIVIDKDLSARGIDFNHQPTVNTYIITTLEQRYKDLNEMLTHPQPIQACSDELAAMTQARTDATTAVNANPYSAANAKELIAAYILAMDIFKQVADQTVSENLQKTMKFGTEFTFTQPAIEALDTEKWDDVYAKAVELIEIWVKEVDRLKKTYTLDISRSQLSGGADKGAHGAKFTYTLPSGSTWWWNLDIDYACLETQAQPTTYNQATGAWENNKDNSTINAIIRDHIFGAAQSIGVRSDAKIGGGHLSLDRATTFGDNARFFRNFLVLYVNEHIQWGQEDVDAVNAPMIADLTSDGKKAFKQEIVSFDTRYANPGPNPMSIDDIVRGLKDKVFIKKHFRQDPENEQAKKKRNEQPAHYHATNVEHMTQQTPPKERRLEMRRFDAQTCIDDLQVDMEKLIDLVVRSRQPGLVPLDNF